MPEPLVWLSILPPPYNAEVGRLVLSRRGEGENDAQIAVRAGLLAFPDVPIFTLSIMAWTIPENILFPEEMIDVPLDGLKVADAQRLLTEQLDNTRKPN